MAKPVYVFSGFLDAGKTRTIKESLLDPNFNEGERTLIIALEEGDEEYDNEFLAASNSIVVYLDSVNELTRQRQAELDIKYCPQRIFIELNGLEDDAILYNEGFAYGWELCQALTIIDSTSFMNYMANMKQFMFNHIKYAETCIFNRADNLDRRYVRNNLKAINHRLDIVYETASGEDLNGFDEELFGDGDFFDLNNDDFGLWYMDALDHPTKYEGKTVAFNARFVEKHPLYDDVVIMGRPAMVCCANDIQYISITCVNVQYVDIVPDKYYHLKGVIHCQQDEMGQMTCVLYVDDYLQTEAPEDEFVYFN